ncbi:hypothetical protein [Dyella acidisoli]|uniref:Uncharacterized protein n=1 Tax=Dyella acidisoli TaxID=1867834 RepID=A0ABQ5XRA0_9GAMM|nr:hypothetical protein [Dyella acidisoli]GLQ93028.1 hypothetical protein GCM10007901_19790 [Dyella acidisoli]
MTSFTRIDQLVARLRTQLKRQNKSAESVQPGAVALERKAGIAAGANHPADLVKALHSAGVTDECVLVTCLVEGLLKREFGDEFSNESQFQQALGLIVETLRDNPETWSLCKECVAQALR